jgi:hypothetical protein
MKPSDKKTLESLGMSKDFDKIAFGLRSLVHEELDADFRETAGALLAGISQVKEKVIETRLSDLTDALRLLRTKIGQREYLKLLADMDPKSAEKIDYYLSVCDPHDTESDHESLAKIASWPDLSETSAKWLARSVTSSSTADDLGILKPFFVHVAEKLLDGTMNAEDDEICKFLSGNEKLIEKIKLALLDARSTDDKIAAGMIVAVRFSTQESLIAVIGPYIENIGTWDRIVTFILSKERTQSLFARAKEVGLDSSLQRLMEESRLANRSLAELLAEDREFQMGLAKLISAQNSFFAICRIFASSEMYTIMKGMFADSDVVSRRATALALAEIGGTSTIPFLKVGLVDKDKAVRETSSSAMQSILGEEAFQEILSGMKEETSSLANMMKPISTLAEQGLSVIRAGVTASGKAISDGASWVGDRAKKVFSGFRGKQE